jgi:ArsR family metal-binding transcriptional regulator
MSNDDCGDTMAFLDTLTLIRTLPCLAEPGKIIVVARPSRTLDGVLPLIAAVAPNTISFNPAAGTLTLRRQPGFITLYPDQVMLSQVQDPEEGQALLAALRDLVNQCWEQRDRIRPVTSARRTPRPLDVWTLLPQSNCKQCGEPTCMAFAFGLLQHKRALEECPVIASDAAFTERRAQLAALA